MRLAVCALRAWSLGLREDCQAAAPLDASIILAPFSWPHILTYTKQLMTRLAAAQVELFMRPQNIVLTSTKRGSSHVTWNEAHEVTVQEPGSQVGDRVRGVLGRGCVRSVRGWWPVCVRVPRPQGVASGCIGGLPFERQYADCVPLEPWQHACSNAAPPWCDRWQWCHLP
jgi:hypothetical protein